VCLFGGGEEFGFDEGEEHSLSSFQARDAGFRSMWFKKHPPDTEVDEDENYVLVDDIKVTESHMEQQFWELVQSPNETVEVEYGADIHSTTHGRWHLFLTYKKHDTYSHIAPCPLWRHIPWILIQKIHGT
jgi:histone demethylase JARID1